MAERNMTPQPFPIERIAGAAVTLVTLMLVMVRKAKAPGCNPRA
jgi:hypothetical protein